MTDTKIVAHPLTRITDIVAAIETGNAVLFSERPERDLSTHRPYYWDTRQYPTTFHHWTEREFECLLEAQQFPPNTFRERRHGRQHAIRKALCAGLYIPPEVLAEPSGIKAVEDAIMDVEASFAAHEAHAAHKRNQEAFNEAMGYSQSMSIAEQMERKLLAAAAAAEGATCDGGIFAFLSPLKSVVLDGLPMPLCVALVTPSLHNPYHCRRYWITVRDARCGAASLYGELRRIAFEKAEVFYRDLIADGVVSLAQARTVMGETWSPYLLVDVHRTETHLENQAVP